MTDDRETIVFQANALRRSSMLIEKIDNEKHKLYEQITVIEAAVERRLQERIDNLTERLHSAKVSNKSLSQAAKHWKAIAQLKGITTEELTEMDSLTAYRGEK